MALTVSSASALSNNDLTATVVQILEEKNPLLQIMPWVDVPGNSHTYAKDGTLPSAGFRDVNDGYTESAGTFDKVSVQLTIMGGDADVDRYLLQTQGKSVADLRAEVTRQKALAVRRAFQDAFINGDADAETGPQQFDGLKNALSGGAVVNAGTNGLGFGTTDTTRAAMLDKLDELIAAVKGAPDVLIGNRQFIAKLRNAQRNMSQMEAGADVFGVTYPSYAGIPVIDLGDTAAGAQIIGNAETKGSSNVASSVYAVRFGAGDGVFGITNGGVQVYDLGEIDAKVAYRTRIEFYCSMAVVNGSAARLEGVLTA